jgi:hypothetical protein
MADLYALSSVGDHALLHGLRALVTRERTNTALLLAHLAEVDARRLYVPAGYPSMVEYCMGELGFFKETAFKRIRVARAARRLPAIFAAVADGRLNLTAVVMLAPHLTDENAPELLAAAEHKSKAEVESLLAERFPRSVMPTWVIPDLSHPLPGAAETPLLVPHPDSDAAGAAAAQLDPDPVPATTPPAKLTAIGPDQVALQVVIGRRTHDKLEYARALLAHQLPSRAVAEVLDRALGALISKLEKRKFAATARPGNARQPGTSRRHIPAHVRRAVWKRDGGRCTFVNDTGKRCPAREMLEFDHSVPVARGGEASVDTIHLLCRAHNQFEADCAFGARFMERKREQARQAAATERAKRSRDRAHATAESHEPASAAAEEVVPYLRALGFRACDARSAAGICETTPDAPLEERVRLALQTWYRKPAPAVPSASPPARG